MGFERLTPAAPSGGQKGRWSELEAAPETMWLGEGWFSLKKRGLVSKSDWRAVIFSKYEVIFSKDDLINRKNEIIPKAERPHLSVG